MRQFAGENFCFELPDCEDLVPKKICVKSRRFSQQCVVWGRGGEAASMRVAGRMDTLAPSCRVAGTDTGKWAVRRTALTLSLEAQCVGEGLGPQPEGERGSRVGNEAAGR